MRDESAETSDVSERRKAKKGRAVCELLRDGGSLGEGDRDFLGGIRLLCDALGKLGKKDKGTRVFSDYALRRFANDRRPSQTRREKRYEIHEKKRTSVTSSRSVISSSRAEKMPDCSAIPVTSSPACATRSGSNLYSTGISCACFSRF